MSDCRAGADNCKMSLDQLVQRGRTCSKNNRDRSKRYAVSLKWLPLGKSGAFSTKVISFPSSLICLRVSLDAFINAGGMTESYYNHLVTIKALIQQE